MRTLIIVLALGALAGPTSASAQMRTSMGSILNEKKPHMLQLQLMRANQLCGTVTDCANADPRHAAQLGLNPCLSDVVGCHTSVSAPSSEQYRSWPVGGVKLIAETGRVSIAFGRHREHIVLARVPFIEGSYRLSGGVSLRAGVLRAHTGPEPHTMAYVALRMSL